ncbi:MAG: hypothetical protein ABFC18_06200 [Rikenellaceae bacterium]
MKILLYMTLIVFVSCSQVNKNNDGQSFRSKQNDTISTEEQKKETVKQTKTGTITTIADGFDVKRVNLFNSTSTDRRINCYLENGDKVKVVEDAEPYYLVEKIGGQDCKGYCMKGFVILDKK